MTTTTLMPLPKPSFQTAIGTPLIGGKIYTYAAGTSNPKATYSDAAGTVAQPNPIPLNVRGEPANAIFWSGNYRVELRDALNNLVYTVDNFNTDPAGLWSILTQLSQAGGSANVGFDPGMPYGVVTSVQKKLRERVSATDYMTDEEKDDVRAGTLSKDVTAAVQHAIDATAPGGVLVWPKGSYKVTTLTTGRMEATWIFDHSEIVAGATTPQTCMLKFSGLHCNFYGMKINGNFNLNYGCLMWWYNDADSSQHNNIFGLDVRYTKRGIVYGALPGNASTGYAQSENSIFGLHTRGVERPLYTNHSNGVLFLVSPVLASHDEEWAAFKPNTFDNNTSFAFEAFGGVLVIEGGEVQNSLAAVTSYCAIIQGGEVYMNNVITEVDTAFQLSGDLTIDGGRVLNTQSVTDQFYIAPGANSKGKLKVSNCKLFRNSGVGSFSSRQLVNNAASAPGIEITFDNCDIIDWGSFVPLVDANNQSARFKNTRWYPDGTQDPHFGVYLLDTQGPNLVDLPAIDATGRTSDGFYQSTWYGGGTTFSLSADVPNTAFAGSLACVATGQAGWFTTDGTSLLTLKATGRRVKPGDKLLVECWIRYVAGGNNQAGAALELFDAAGARLATPYLRVFDQNNFVTDQWQYLRNVVTIPAGVAYVGFGAQGIQSEVRFCGLEVRRATWNKL